MEADAFLISTTYDTDDLEQQIPVESKKQIYATIKSVSQNEAAKAGQQGLRSELCLETSIYSYSGEPKAEYNGKRYVVYRTFTKQEEERIELYLGTRVGENA